jgi:hypothetical protein
VRPLLALAFGARTWQSLGRRKAAFLLPPRKRTFANEEQNVYIWP